jgi:hypothetical protein
MNVPCVLPHIQVEKNRLADYNLFSVSDGESKLKSEYTKK